MKDKKTSGFRKFLISVTPSLLSILIGLLFGCLIIVIVGLVSKNFSAKSIGDGIKMILFGIFNTGRVDGKITFGFNPITLGNVLFRAIPLIMTGLSVAFSFKTGLFNIGASGQYLAGTAATLFIALTIPSDTVPPFVIWLLALLGGMVAGAVWGMIPGIAKAYLNINEVLACILTNWIAANIVTWVFDISNLKNSAEYGKINLIMKTTQNGVETPKLMLDKLFPGSQVNGGILVAILIAIIIYIMMNKTTFGYSLRACGYNRSAARYAGINDKRSIVLSMMFSGALAGGAAALYWLSGNTEFAWETYQTLPAEGFNGISVALLASSNPIGVIFSGLFMSIVTISGQQLKAMTPYNEYITDIIIAVIIYMSSFSLFFRNLMTGKNKKKAEKHETRFAPEAPKTPMEALNQATENLAKVAAGAEEVIPEPEAEADKADASEEGKEA